MNEKASSDSRVERTITQLSLLVEMEDTHFEYGRTRLFVNGNGRVLVESLDGETKSFTGELPKREVLKLFSGFAESIPDDVWRTKAAERVPREDLAALGRRPGIPDEPRYRIEMRLQEAPLSTVTIWAREAEHLPVFRELLERSREIVTSVTDGQVML